MNKQNRLFLATLLFFSFGCDHGTPPSVETSTDSTDIEQEVDSTDSLIQEKPDTLLQEPTTNRDNWTISDYIQPPFKQHLGLQNQLKWLIEEWKNIPNPFTATYDGNDFGDYHHIFFTIKNGKTLDFGQANNLFGEYELFDPSGQYEDNPKYVGKTFTVYWDWKLATFPCCEGEYDMVEAYLPTITGLELVETK